MHIRKTKRHKTVTFDTIDKKRGVKTRVLPLNSHVFFRTDLFFSQEWRFFGEETVGTPASGAGGPHGGAKLSFLSAYI